jgi:hypothetical protein
VQDASEAVIEQAIVEGSIVRTWSMRGTIHFVPAADVHWMLKLLTPRIIALSARRYQELGLDTGIFARCEALIVAALSGGKRLTRQAIYALWEQGGIADTQQRGSHILGHLAQHGVICAGPHEGKQQTFVLLDEWVSAPRQLERDEALAEIARVYFNSHAPATLPDFSWWTGLIAADAKAALEMVKPELTARKIDGGTYWQRANAPTTPAPTGTPTAHLLPQYDEYMVAYRDRSAALDPAWGARTGNGIFRQVVVIDGQVVGTWTRTIKKSRVAVEVKVLRLLSSDEQWALDAAIQRYRDFLGYGDVEEGE